MGLWSRFIETFAFWWIVKTAVMSLAPMYVWFMSPLDSRGLMSGLGLTRLVMGAMAGRFLVAPGWNCLVVEGLHLRWPPSA